MVRRRQLRTRLAREERLEAEELLELVLDYGAPNRDNGALERSLSAQFGTLEGVLSAPEEALKRVKELPEGTLVLLRLLSCLVQRAGETGAEPELGSTERQVEYLMPLFHRQRRERVYVLCLDPAGRLLSCELLGEGGEALVALEVERVCALAGRCGAAAVVLSHSHPSGVAMPSQEDILTTRACGKALSGQGVRLADHLIFADGDCVSMAESGLL